MASKPKASAADDFRRKARESARTEMLMLPSGLRALVRRLSPSWFLFRGRLPASLAQQVAGEKPGSMTTEQVLAQADFITALMEEVMVSPRVKLHPGPDEISPDEITDADLTYIVNFALGEIAPGGSDLSTFREGAKPVAVGAGGRNLEMPSQRPARRKRDRVSA